MNNWYNNAGTNVSLEEISPDNNAWLIENTVVSYGGSNISICQYPDEEYTLNVNVLEKSPGTNIRFVVRDADGDFITLTDLVVGENTFSYTYNGSEQRARIQFQVEGIGSMLIDDMSITGAGMANQYPGISRSYTAVPLMKADYYPFGMTMPGRNENTDDYRYAYNGMETDPEMKGNGNSYTTEFRQYDPRIGRWMSLDPLMMSFPWMSPYVAFDNNPVYFVDPYGLESKDGNGGGSKGEDGTGGGDPPGGNSGMMAKDGKLYLLDNVAEGTQIFDKDGIMRYKYYNNGWETNPEHPQEVEETTVVGKYGKPWEDDEQGRIVPWDGESYWIEPSRNYDGEIVGFYKRCLSCGEYHEETLDEAILETLGIMDERMDRANDAPIHTDEPANGFSDPKLPEDFPFSQGNTNPVYGRPRGTHRENGNRDDGDYNKPALQKIDATTVEVTVYTWQDDPNQKGLKEAIESKVPMFENDLQRDKNAFKVNGKWYMNINPPTKGHEQFHK